jgi:predicted nucleic acid-binding protein
MIAIDTSAFIAYLQNTQNYFTDILEKILQSNSAVLPPVVLTELLSDGAISQELIDNLIALPILEPTAGYWERAGKTRAKILQKKFKARLADTLIAQICIDHNVPLITLDTDFKHFAKYCGLKLISA